MPPEKERLLKDFLKLQLGKPYKFGAEVGPREKNPLEWDCSELVEIAFAHIGLKFPDGARYQLHACRKMKEDEREKIGDLGFLVDPPGSPARHVVMVYDEKNVIEARGRPASKVILCDKTYWRGRRGFLFWYRPEVIDRLDKEYEKNARQNKDVS